MDQTDVSAAEGEGDLEPGISQRKDEYTVSQILKFSRQRPQQRIHRAQPKTGQAGGGKLTGRNTDGIHFSRRLSQPPVWRGSS